MNDNKPYEEYGPVKRTIFRWLHPRKADHLVETLDFIKVIVLGLLLGGIVLFTIFAFFYTLIDILF